MCCCFHGFQCLHRAATSSGSRRADLSLKGSSTGLSDSKLSILVTFGAEREGIREASINKSHCSMPSANGLPSASSSILLCSNVQATTSVGSENLSIYLHEFDDPTRVLHLAVHVGVATRQRTHQLKANSKVFAEQFTTSRWPEKRARVKMIQRKLEGVDKSMCPTEALKNMGVTLNLQFFSYSIRFKTCQRCPSFAVSLSNYGMESIFATIVPLDILCPSRSLVELLRACGGSFSTCLGPVNDAALTSNIFLPSYDIAASIPPPYVIVDTLVNNYIHMPQRILKLPLLTYAPLEDVGMAGFMRSELITVVEEELSEAIEWA
ncbi:hypothetical protein EDD18DRAFT_1113438 [Armillaria luteobubalina]|uniref:Uncharacterized protein n=1 Tax=Armillaria luteobubalina TaxID=153913 RepID=A0AA39UJ57_9AGAR|nr:hypothetical protein EDD18DRAFT_1113438 [Armillaria luteobubalina]